MSAIYNLGQTVRIGPSDANIHGIEVRDAAGTLTIADSDQLIVTAPYGTPAEPATFAYDDGIYYADTEASAPGVWAWRWTFQIGAETVVAAGYYVVTASPTAVEQRPMFASVADLEMRLGRTLSATEVDQAIWILPSITTLIADALGRDDEWAQNYIPVPDGLRVLCAEAGARALTQLPGVGSTQEQLGSYLYSTNYRATDAQGVMLTHEEGRRARRIVYGTNSAGVEVPGVLESFIEVDGEQDAS